MDSILEVLDLILTVMHIEDLLGDRQSESSPAGLAAARQLPAVESLPDMIERVFRDVVAPVPEDEGRVVVIALDIDGDGASLLRMADGIHQEVQHHRRSHGR